MTCQDRVRFKTTAGMKAAALWSRLHAAARPSPRPGDPARFMIIGLACISSLLTNFVRCVAGSACDVMNHVLLRQGGEQGCSLAVTDNDGNTAWHAAAEGGHMEAVECLLQAKAQIESANAAGCTALHIAARSGTAFTGLVVAKSSQGAVAQVINNDNFIAPSQSLLIPLLRRPARRSMLRQERAAPAVLLHCPSSPVIPLP